MYLSERHASQISEMISRSRLDHSTTSTGRAGTPKRSGTPLDKLEFDKAMMESSKMTKTTTHSLADKKICLGFSRSNLIAATLQAHKAT